MKLRLVHIRDEGLNKVLILDDTKTKEQGKLVACVTMDNKDEAISEAKDLANYIARHGKLTWH